MQWFNPFLSSHSELKLFTNSIITPEKQVDSSKCLPFYNKIIPYGEYGVKVLNRLNVFDEDSHTALQYLGWSGTGMCYYDKENQIGAYGGYTFTEPLFITKIKFWLGRYSGQNRDLTITSQYLDSQSEWQDIEDFIIGANTPYPSNIFISKLNPDNSIYGVRWIHKKGNVKSNNNNITFAGMTVYEKAGDGIPCFTSDESGFFQIPEGYDGFGTIYI